MVQTLKFLDSVGFETSTPTIKSKKPRIKQRTLIASSNKLKQGIAYVNRCRILAEPRA